MKEKTMIEKFNLAAQERLQNNGMIGALMKDVEQLQQMSSGLLSVLRKLPGYQEAIDVLSKESKEAEAEEVKKATEISNQATLDEAIEEATKELDMGKDD